MQGKVGNITNDKISKTPEAIANGMRVNYRKPQRMLDILNAFIVVNGIKYPINAFTILLLIFQVKPIEMIIL
jgi:hypothetical protein